MKIEPNLDGTGSRVSTKDRILCIPFGFSALLAFALSFSLFQSGGRPYVFFSCLLICAVTLAFIERKKDVILASVIFIFLRVVWSALITGHQVLRYWGSH